VKEASHRTTLIRNNRTSAKVSITTSRGKGRRRLRGRPKGGTRCARKDDEVDRGGNLNGNLVTYDDTGFVKKLGKEPGTCWGKKPKEGLLSGKEEHPTKRTHLGVGKTTASGVVTEGSKRAGLFRKP